MFLDLGLGILVAVAFSVVFGFELSWPVVTAAAVFSLAPDIDVFAELFTRGKVGGKIQSHHRRLTHFPLTYIPVAILIYFYMGLFWSWLFIGLVLLHFLHDSVGTGWGLKWFWPFSKKTYKFFSKKDGRFSKNFIVCWQPEELRRIVFRYGDNHWFKNYYLRFHPLAVFELAVFLAALAILYVSVR